MIQPEKSKQRKKYTKDGAMSTVRFACDNIAVKILKVAVSVANFILKAISLLIKKRQLGLVILITQVKIM